MHSSKFVTDPQPSNFPPALLKLGGEIRFEIFDVEWPHLKRHAQPKRRRMCFHFFPSWNPRISEISGGFEPKGDGCLPVARFTRFEKARQRWWRFALI